MSTDVTLRHLRSFLVAAELGNFTLAASRMHLTQPGISRNISELERTLGQRLFSRSGRRVVLTPRGVELSRSLRSVLADLDATLVRGDPCVVRIGFSHFLPSQWSSELISRVESGGMVRIELCRRDDVRAALDRGECDVIVTHRDLHGADYATYPLARESRVAAVGSGCDLVEHEAVGWPEIGRRRVVVNVLDGCTRPDMWDPAVPEDSVVPCRNAEEWLELIALGRGVGVAPASAQHRLSHPGVRYVPVLDGPVALTQLAVRRVRMTPEVEEFCWLASGFSSDRAATDGA